MNNPSMATIKLVSGSKATIELGSGEKKTASIPKNLSVKATDKVLVVQVSGKYLIINLY